MSMKIHLLGTCSGTEPQPNRHQVSWVLELDGGLYWFDAGESCAYTAHLLGLPLMEIKTIFISHGHMDHVGGLPHLLWTIRKLDGRNHHIMAGRSIDVFLPNPRSWDGLMTFMQETEGNFNVNFTLDTHLIAPGRIFDNGKVAVEALRNHHIPSCESFSFRILAEGRKIVFSGDVKSIAEMEAWLDEGCDLLLMETGHHKVLNVCNYIKERPQVKKLVFIHHGREILEHYEEAWATAVSVLGDGGRVEIGYDRQLITEL